jgi:hypothetical protein
MSKTDPGKAAFAKLCGDTLSSNKGALDPQRPGGLRTA